MTENSEHESFLSFFFSILILLSLSSFENLIRSAESSFGRSLDDGADLECLALQGWIQEFLKEGGSGSPKRQVRKSLKRHSEGALTPQNPPPPRSASALCHIRSLRKEHIAILLLKRLD